MKLVNVDRTAKTVNDKKNMASGDHLEMTLFEFLREFNINRKNTLIYPRGHIQIVQGLDRIHRLLDRITGQVEKIEIGVTGEALLVFGRFLDIKNGVFREIAEALHLFDIAAITFIRGVQQSELARLFQSLARAPESVRNKGGLQTVLSESDVDHVLIHHVNYHKIQHTEEKEIQKVDSSGEEDSHKNLWYHFILHSMSDTLVTAEQGIVLDHSQPPNPTALARLLNEGRIDSESVLESFMHTIRESLTDESASSTETIDSQVYMKSLNALLKELRPNLRRQFLSVTYNQCAAKGSSESVESFLSGLSNIFIVEMLRQANKSGEELSPSLLNLVYKIVNVQDAAAIEKPEFSIKETAKGRTGESNSKDLLEIGHLFKREDYESYIPDTYSDMLKSLSEEGVVRETDEYGSRYLKKILPTLDDSYLDRRIATALLSFLTCEIDKNTYSEYAERLFQMSDELLNHGNFSTLSNFIETLEAHQEVIEIPEIHEIAIAIRERFQDPSFVSRAVTAFYQWSIRKKRSSTRFILLLGPKIVPEILMLYAKMESRDKAPFLYAVLSRFPEHVCTEARKRLYDSRPFFVKNLISLIRHMGCRECAEPIRELMAHPDLIVRLEGLETLISFKDPRALYFLRKYLNSGSKAEYGPAIRLAGKYTVTEILEDLLFSLRRFGLSKSDYHKNEMIISAMGKIGDRRTIPVLSKLVKIKFWLYPGERKRMNITLFKSLIGYKRSVAMPLIKYGSTFGSAVIKEICNDLIGNPDLSN